MARSIKYWYDIIITEKNTFSNLNTLQPNVDDAQTLLSDVNTTSRVARWRLWMWCVAVVAWTQDVLFDFYKLDLADKIKKAVPSTELWWKVKILGFQYDAGSPQVMTLVDLVPTYAVIDESLRIITRCSVVTKVNKVVAIKVATGTTGSLSPLGALPLAALNSCIEVMRPAGVTFVVVNEDSDKIRIAAKVYYNGQYSSTIQANVMAAINEYLVNIEFNGRVKISMIEDAIQAVPGVTDVEITEVKARRNTVALGAALVVERVYDTFSGYIIEETTAGNTFTDTIEFFVEN